MKFNMGAWILAARPKTLLASSAPVVIGSLMAFAYGVMNWVVLVLAFLSASFIQIGTNLANDYYDFKKGADTDDRKGPKRVTQAGLISPEHVKKGFISSFCLAFIFGLYLMVHGGLPIVIIGLTSILFAYLYTGGPFPLAYNGLGDIFVLIYFGPVAVAGTYFLHTREFFVPAIVSGIALGAISVAILTVNNLRDINEDRVANKKTLIVRFGPLFGKIEYVVCVFAGLFTTVYTTLILLIDLEKTLNLPFLLALVFALGATSMLIIKVWTVSGEALNKYLGLTAALLLFHLLFYIVVIFI